MSINGSGICDTARVLKISSSTVIEELKKEAEIKYVNEGLLKQLDLSRVKVEVREHLEDAECDEMWSFVGSKAQQRWIWLGLTDFVVEAAKQRNTLSRRSSDLGNQVGERFPALKGRQNLSPLQGLVFFSVPVPRAYATAAQDISSLRDLKPQNPLVAMNPRLHHRG